MKYKVGDSVLVRDDKLQWWPGKVWQINDWCVFVEVKIPVINGRKRYPAGCSLKQSGRYGFEFAIPHAHASSRIRLPLGMSQPVST